MSGTYRTNAVSCADRQTTKCRIIFDASAHEQDSVSLNNCVLPGPALQPNLASHFDFNTDKVCNSLRIQVLIDTCAIRH